MFFLGSFISTKIVILESEVMSMQKQKDFILEEHGISSYSCCNTSDYIPHRQQQELTKRTPNLGVQKQK